MTVRNPLAPPVRLVIDTNLFLILIGYQCSTFERMKPHERTRILTEIRGRDDDISPELFDYLWNLFRNAAVRIVTQHVIAETYGSRDKLSSFRHQNELVWRSAETLLHHPGVEEESCTIRDVLERKEYHKILREIGPSDAGLILTAERRNATVITDDGGLIYWAGVRSVQAVPFQQIPNLLHRTG